MVSFYFYREKELLQAGISSYQGILCKFLWIVPPVCKGCWAGEERATFTTCVLLEIYNLYEIYNVHWKVQNSHWRHPIPQNQLFSGQAGRQELTKKSKGRNLCHIYDGDFVNKCRKDAGTSVSSSASFVYVITLTIKRQGNVKPEERLIYLVKTIHYWVAHFTVVL